MVLFYDVGNILIFQMPDISKVAKLWRRWNHLEQSVADVYWELRKPNRIIMKISCGVSSDNHWLTTVLPDIYEAHDTDYGQKTTMYHDSRSTNTSIANKQQEASKNWEQMKENSCETIDDFLGQCNMKNLSRVYDPHTAECRKVKWSKS